MRNRRREAGAWALLIEDKLDGVGPVDNRPSTDKLHHFVQKKTKQKKTR